jgi:hypothetical protein
MRHFENYAQLSAALDLPADAPGAFRFAPAYGPATFYCVACKARCLLDTVGGFTPGYAQKRDSDDMVCYPCADALQVAEIRDSAGPFYCYVSSDGKRVTTWTGGTLGTVTNYGESRAGWNGGTIARFHVTDVHGRKWYGRGGGRGMCCTLRLAKNQ